jgi:hypothetical protein
MTKTIQGAVATAERFPIPAVRSAAQEATLAGWLIDAPGQSPAWHHYLISVIHLRAIPGAPPAHIRRPGATHELILCALDSLANPTVNDVETIRHLTPLNAQVQFAATDDLAVHVGELAVKAICDGYMPAEPASSYVGQREWEQVIDNTIEHHRDGRCCQGDHP